MAFNLKKHAKGEASQTQEERLQQQRDRYNVELPVPTGNTDKLLGDVRKDKEPKGTYESILSEAREGKEYDKTVEGQIDGHDVPEGLPARTGEDSFTTNPVNLLEIVNDKKRGKAYENASLKDAETMEWDQLLGVEPVKAGPSQLHNSEDRFKRLTEKDVLKNKNVKKMVMASLADADAMLYFIYRKAAGEGRELNAKERQLVDQITADKTKLVEIFGPETL